MEIFIRDEEKYCNKCRFANPRPSFICGGAIAERIGTNMSVCSLCYGATHFNKCPLKSLDQHDAEVRAEERKKWQDKFDELSQFIDEKTENLIYYDRSLYVETETVRQKLTELKGE